MKNLNVFIGNRTRDLLAHNAMPQPTLKSLIIYHELVRLSKQPSLIIYEGDK
jgi:hypothetical protein